MLFQGKPSQFFRDPALLPITIPLPPSLLHIAWSLAPKQEPPWKKDNSPGDVPQLLRVGKVAGGEAWGNKVHLATQTTQHHGHPQNVHKTSIAKKNSFNSKKLNKKISTSTGLVGDRHHDDHWERVESHQSIPWVHRTRKASHIHVYVYNMYTARLSFGCLMLGPFKSTLPKLFCLWVPFLFSCFSICFFLIPVRNGPPDHHHAWHFMTLWLPFCSGPENVIKSSNFHGGTYVLIVLPIQSKRGLCHLQCGMGRKTPKKIDQDDCAIYWW